MSSDNDIKLGFVNSYWVLPDTMFINQDYTIKVPLRIYNGRKFVHDHLLKENYIYNASMAIFRRDALLQVEEQYMTFHSCGDKLFWKEVAKQGKVLFLCEPLNYFRIHNSKVTANSIANGLLFAEENKFFHMNIADGTITYGKTRLNVIRYFLKYIENVKIQLLSDNVYINSRKLWEKESDFKNKDLPLLFRGRCLLYNILKNVFK